jgi:hypothetical protein
MFERATLAQIRARCAHIDARMSGLEAWSLNLFEYPRGKAPGLPIGHVYLERGGGRKLIRMGNGFVLQLPVRCLQSELGPHGATYYALGNGWVLHVLPETQVEHIGASRCVLCDGDLHGYEARVTACSGCRDD